MLANNRNRLSRGDVVAGIPVVFAGSIEVIFDNFLPPRNSVPSTHIEGFHYRRARRNGASYRFLLVCQAIVRGSRPFPE